MFCGFRSVSPLLSCYLHLSLSVSTRSSLNVSNIYSFASSPHEPFDNNFVCCDIDQPTTTTTTGFQIYPPPTTPPEPAPPDHHHLHMQQHHHQLQQQQQQQHHMNAMMRSTIIGPSGGGGGQQYNRGGGGGGVGGIAGAGGHLVQHLVSASQSSLDDITCNMANLMIIHATVTSSRLCAQIGCWLVCVLSTYLNVRACLCMSCCRCIFLLSVMLS